MGPFCYEENPWVENKNKNKDTEITHLFNYKALAFTSHISTAEKILIWQQKAKSYFE